MATNAGTCEFKEAVRSAMAKYGARGAAWMAAGRTEAEMAALDRMGGTPLGARLEACPHRLVTTIQAAELFGVATSTWSRHAQRGALPASVAVGATVRWRTEELITWAAGGCTVGNIPRAAPQPLFLERGNDQSGDGLVDLSPAAAAAMAGLSVGGLAAFSKSGAAPSPDAHGRYNRPVFEAWIREGCPRIR
jgi:predicted DNA-binding transcriptional regulator AlpA